MSAFEIDIGLVVKSPSSVPCRSSSSSPTSTLSDSATNVSTNKKPRTPRKRPNQSYTEAVALLAKIHPNIFSAKNLMKHCKLAKLHHDPFRDSSELLLLPPFPGLSDAGFLLHNNAGHPEEAVSAVVIPENPKFSCSKNKYSTYYCSFSSPSSCNQSTGEVVNCDIDMDTESLLDEEIGEDIDSIMGIPMIQGETTREYSALINPYLGHLGGRYQMNMTRALRCVGNGDWWHSSPTIEIQNIVSSMKPAPTPASVPEKKTKKNKNTKLDSSTTSSTSTSSSIVSASLIKPALSLKLNHECVMKEWIGRGSLFSLTAADLSESPTDIIGKLSDMDLFSEVAGSGTLREASVLRYKEKRRNRLFSKKIRYQVRKMNADRRPRMKASSVRFP